MTTRTLYKAGYVIRVTSWENDGDNYRTKEMHIAEKEKLDVVVEFVKLFTSRNNYKNRGIGNLCYGEEAYNTAFSDFYEEYMPWFCEDVDLEGAEDEDEKREIIAEHMIGFAYDLGLTGSEDYATRVLHKFEVIYFPQDVLCEDVTEEYK